MNSSSLAQAPFSRATGGAREGEGGGKDLVVRTGHVHGFLGLAEVSSSSHECGTGWDMEG